MARYEAEIAQLFDVLSTVRCEIRADIADATGWSMAKVGSVLAEIRTPDTAQEWGWTVPPVRRGPGRDRKVFLPVAAGDPAPDEATQEGFMDGAHSTCQAIRHMSENHAHAMRTLAGMFTIYGYKKKARRIVAALEGAAAMAGDMAEALAERNGAGA